MTSEMKQIVERFDNARSLLCLTHVHADGDGLGSMAAIVQAARETGAAVAPMVHEPVPRRYEFLFRGPHEASLAYSASFESLAAQADLVVLLDTCSRSQLGALSEPIDAVREKTVVIDHHVTCDDIGSVRWIDTSAAAVGVMILELLEALDWPIRPHTAQVLAAAIVSDTGWVRFSNTDGRALRAFAKLLDAGATASELYERIYQGDRLERVRLMGRVLGNLELYCDGRLAVMVLRKADFRQTGARSDETENLINEAMRLGSVEVAVMLVENLQQDGADAGWVRVSFRSRKKVDVARIGARFGGGGHERAAGFRSDEKLDVLKTQIIQAVSQTLESS